MLEVNLNNAAMKNTYQAKDISRRIAISCASQATGKHVLKCIIPWHSDSTCEQTTSHEARGAQNIASEEFVKAECRLCPELSSPCRQETGCDHIVCEFYVPN